MDDMETGTTYTARLTTEPNPKKVAETREAILDAKPELTWAQADGLARERVRSIQLAVLQAAADEEMAAEEAAARARAQRVWDAAMGKPADPDEPTGDDLIADWKGEPRPARPVARPPVFTGVTRLVGGPRGDGFYLEEQGDGGQRSFHHSGPFATMADAYNAASDLSRP